MRSSMTAGILAGLFLLTACGGDGQVTPDVLDTFAYSDNGVQRVACCEEPPEEGYPPGDSPEYPVAGVDWWDGSWHEGDSEPVPCIKPDRRNPVRVGYVETQVTDDAPGNTLIVWLKCGR